MLSLQPVMWSYLLTCLGVLAAFFHVLGILSAVHAVWNCRTSVGAIAWSLSLTLFPYFTVPAYWIFGRNRFLGYVHNFQADSFDRNLVAEDLSVAQGFRPQLEGRAASVQQGFESLACFPLTGRNQVDLLIDGDAAFAALFRDIESAQSYVFLEYYIIASDRIGYDFQRLLIRKAREGVKISVVYDEMGCLPLSRKFIRELREAGVEMLPFTSGPWLRGRLQVNFRNHRKIAVIDGRIAQVGGINISDESLGRNPFYGPWRDTHVRIEGPAVAGIQLTFLDDYHWASGGRQPERLQSQPRACEGDDAAVYVGTGPADSANDGTLFFIHSIHSATRRLWLATPYFIPLPSVMDALKAAVLRGVDVRVIIPLRWDLLVMYLAAYSYLPEAEEAGIKVYRYAAGHPHQKVMLVDDDLAWVGSANLDARSMCLNFEGNLVVQGQRFAKTVEEMLKHDLDRSHPVGADEYKRRGFVFKLGVKLARLFEPIL